MQPLHIRLSIVLVCLWFGTSDAAPFVPEPLQPWVGWVKEQIPEADCPFLTGETQRECQWITGIELRLADGHGSFRMAGANYREGWLMLPGSRAHWPDRVEIDGRSANVLEQGGRPALWLEPGAFEVLGDFTWTRLPSALEIPPGAGLVRLFIDGEAAAVNRDAQGRLWLRDRLAAADLEAQDRLELHVHRRISDLSPIRLDTELVLDAAGQQREVVLAAPMLEGFIPIELRSPLPARIEPDGRLRVQLRPGSWHIGVSAYRPGEVGELAVPAGGAGWPAQEVWVFAAQPQLRQVEPQGLPPVDPQQTSLPDDWRQLPAFLAAPGQRLRLVLQRRGDEEPEPDALALNRTLWLDFDGGGYTVQDHLSGRVTRAWRLETDPALALGRVEVDGTDQLITQRQDSGNRGVEVRRGLLRLSADSRYEGDRESLPIGWRHDLNSAQASLNLPPGWDLLRVGGVDNDPPSWVQRWTLLDLFLVLILVIAVTKLWGASAGVLAFAALGLTWHGYQAPQQVWLHLVGVLALLRVVPPGRLRWWIRAYRNLVLVALVVILVPFIVQQARTAIYPQLDQRHPHLGMDLAGDAAPQAEAAPAPAPTSPSFVDGTAVLERRVAKAAGVLIPQGADQRRRPDFQRIDPTASVQTGPGLPHWQWRRVPLSWNGPVSMEQRVSLTLLSPWQNRAIHLAQIVLLLAFGGLLLRDRVRGGPGAWLRALRISRGGADV